MNILYLNTTYQCGGAEKVTAQLFHGMRRRGHRVYQIVSYDTKKSVLPAGVHVLYNSAFMRIFNRLITGNHGNQNLHIWYSRKYIMAFIKKNHIDIVHLNNPHDNFLGIGDIADIAEVCPVIWTLHDFWAMTGHCTYPHGCEDLWKTECTRCQCLDNYPALRKDVAHELFVAKQGAFHNRNIVFTVPSKWMHERFEESHLKGENVKCIYNGLDVDAWKPLDKKVIRKKYQLDEGKRILGFIAADPKKKLKGMDYLLEALSNISEPEKYLLLLAGQANDVAETLGKKGFHVCYLGYLTAQQELNEFYAMADILVNPSVYETFGLTNIEAMACGTPVVAFPVCTMPELIDVSSGWIASEVSVRALSDAIEEAFSDMNVMKDKSESSRKRVEKFFSEKKMLDQFEELYKTKKKS